MTEPEETPYRRLRRISAEHEERTDHPSEWHDGTMSECISWAEWQCLKCTARGRASW